jgi:hypothetical protein
LEDETMPAYKFRIGQMVTYRSAERGVDAAPSAYMVVARLPHGEETGELEYRIRNLNEGHDRVAKESELRGR